MMWIHVTAYAHSCIGITHPTHKAKLKLSLSFTLQSEVDCGSHASPPTQSILGNGASIA